MLYDIFSFFPNRICKILKDNITQDEIKTLEEIRLRNNRNIILKLNNKEKILEYIITSNDILETLQIICENSIYSYQKEISEGFLTVKGGHRIGISGSCIIENGKVININYISSLNFRIARQVVGCSNNIIKELINIENKTIYNTLIVSLPGAGKTTLLRDIIRNISNGSSFFSGFTVGVVDERGEIAASYKGVSQNDVGIRTDVVSNVPKSIGMKMLIRSMAPQVIAADEIGGAEDVNAIQEIICSRNKRNFYSTWSKFRRDITKQEFKRNFKFTYI